MRRADCRLRLSKSREDNNTTVDVISGRGWPLPPSLAWFVCRWLLSTSRLPTAASYACTDKTTCMMCLPSVLLLLLLLRHGSVGLAVWLAAVVRGYPSSRSCG